MSTVLQLKDNREQHYARLSPEGSLIPNQKWLACMLASWCEGLGVLPDYLGLESEQFTALTACFFPGIALPERAPSGSVLDYSRMLEKEDLINLLKQYSKADTPETTWMIAIIVAGCLGSDHLWQDLGLWQRSQLSAMLHYNFPKLAAKNTKDMKWKKFLYKQLCEAEGITLCRAPSCEVCIDYPNCFGAEE